MPFSSGVTQALGDSLVGVYLAGSHALGCADEWSDVDFLVVVSARLSDDQLSRLGDLHAVLPDHDSRLLQHLEGSYAPAADLASPMTLGRRWWYVDNGARTLSLSDHDNTAHHRWVLREHGVVLHGPDPAGLVAAVSAEALRAEALGDARARAEHLEDDPGAYADAWSQPSCVLTCCRILVTAAEGRVAGKHEAAAWARPRVDPSYAPLIDAAVAARPHPLERVGQPADPALAEPTRAFVWETVRLAGTWALEARG